MCPACRPGVWHVLCARAAMVRVLVAEDHPILRLDLADLLSASGYQVLTAANGREALEQIRRDQPEAAVVDLNMPLMDGFQLIAACRREPACRGLPILAVSATWDVQEAARRLAPLGVRQVLQKPFAEDALLHALAQLISSAA